MSVKNIVGSQLLFFSALFIKECHSWPEGTYGLPMPKAGCPSTKDFEWLTGSRIQQTEKESHASSPVNLAGVQSPKTDTIVQNFCMKTSYPKYGDYFWGRGSYCIFKKGTCPRGFKSGWIYWDDAAPLFFSSTIQNYSGTVPDGSYNRNTKIEYCCRKDGGITNDITLPTDAPFYLFKNAEGCQKVKNTAVTEEWVYWADEDFFNFSGLGGQYPKVHRSKHPIKFTKLFYCYYIPSKAPEKNYKVTMTVIYCIAGVLGGFLLVFILTVLIQRCHCKPCLADSNDIAVNEAMIRQPSAPAGVSNSIITGSASTVNHLRRNGAANRDNELESYTDTNTQQAQPPRYSQINNHRRKTPRVPHEESVPMVSVVQPDAAESGSCNTLPPSYDEVIRDKTHEEET